MGIFPISSLMKFIYVAIFTVLGVWSITTSEQRPIFSSVRGPANFFSCYESIMKFMDPEVFYGASTMKFVEANSLGALEKAYGEESFIQIQRRLDEKIILQQNKNLRKILKEAPALKPSSTKATYVTKAEADDLYKAMVSNKVVMNDRCYDTGGIGFCFGRATVAHIEALLRGVHPSALKKVWVTGDMGFWGHHVALVVKGKKDWYVIDNVVGKVVTIDQWMDNFIPRKQAGAKEVMFHITQAERFGPDHSRGYNPIDFFNSLYKDGYSKDNDFYNGFFHDFFDDTYSRAQLEQFAPR
jgi:hypothetical protein